jgi:hypothetical protein
MKNFWKFLIGFLALMVLVGGGYFVWDRYLSPQAKANRETQKNYEKYLAWQENYEKAMTEDTFGGKTPEETLQMFIEALKKEDIELASKYFSLETNTQDPNYLTRKKWEEGLKKEKESNRLNIIADIITKSKLDFSHRSEQSAWFTVDNKEGMAEYTIILRFNKYSSVWKIESL